MTIPVEKLVKAYVKIRNKRSELKSEFEDQNKKLADKQAKLGRALLDHCKEHNVDSVKTGEGLFYARSNSVTGLTIGKRCTSS